MARRLLPSLDTLAGVRLAALVPDAVQTKNRFPPLPIEDGE